MNIEKNYCTCQICTYREKMEPKPLDSWTTVTTGVRRQSIREKSRTTIQDFCHLCTQAGSCPKLHIKRMQMGQSKYKMLRLEVGRWSHLDLKYIKCSRWSHLQTMHLILLVSQTKHRASEKSAPAPSLRHVWRCLSPPLTCHIYTKLSFFSNWTTTCLLRLFFLVNVVFVFVVVVVVEKVVVMRGGSEFAGTVSCLWNENNWMKHLIITYISLSNLKVMFGIAVLR